MNRASIGLVALMALVWPALVHAQNDQSNRRDSDQEQYNDVEDGQALKLVSYALMPVGMVLEWGITRPLHYMATKTPAAPLLSGDSDTSFFGETDNASQLPPGTFAPYKIDANAQPSKFGPLPAAEPATTVPQTTSVVPVTPLAPASVTSQPALH
jgi:hypothetical protein